MLAEARRVDTAARGDQALGVKLKHSFAAKALPSNSLAIRDPYSEIERNALFAATDDVGDGIRHFRSPMVARTTIVGRKGQASNPAPEGLGS